MIAREHDGGLSHYITLVGRFPVLDCEEELRLARRFRRGDRRAGDHLVLCHLRDVVGIASRYRGYGLRLADLVAEGNVGLVEAVLRFDPRRKLRFMTYAAYWIRAAVLAHVLRHFSIVGVGTSPLQSRLFFRLLRERGRLHARLGEGEASVTGRLAAKFGATRERIEAMTERLERRDQSLDAPMRDAPGTLVPKQHPTLSSHPSHAKKFPSDMRKHVWVLSVLILNKAASFTVSGRSLLQSALTNSMVLFSNAGSVGIVLMATSHEFAYWVE